MMGPMLATAGQLPPGQVTLSRPAEIALLVVGILVVVGILFALSRGMARRRRDVWQQFAQRHALRYRDQPAPQVEGVLEGRPVRLAVLSESSDTGVAGVEQVSMEVGILGPLPPGLQVMPAEGIVGEAQRLADRAIIETGDEEFDRRVIVHCDRPQEAVEYLDESRRRAILDLMGHREYEPGIRDRKASFRDRTMFTEFEACERQLRVLLEIAKRLDGPD